MYQIIPQKDHAKYLGIFIDSTLTWNNHIKHVNLKIAKGIGIIAWLRYLSCDVIRSLFFSFVQPYIDYGVVNWGSAPCNNLNVVRRSLDKAIRVMLFKRQKEPMLPLYKQLKILDFDNHVKFTWSIFIWKIYHGCAPVSFSSDFVLKYMARSLHENAIQFQIPTVNTDYKKWFITYSGIITWNAIPYIIRTENNFCCSQRKLKAHFLFSLIPC